MRPISICVCWAAPPRRTGNEALNRATLTGRTMAATEGGDGTMAGDIGGEQLFLMQNQKGRPVTLIALKRTHEDGPVTILQ